MVDRVRVLGGDVVVRAVDLVDLVVRFGGENSSLVGDAEAAEVLVFDLVLRAGPVAGTATVCISPTLWPSSGTSISIS